MKFKKNVRKYIYCCGCSKDVLARLTVGVEIYPHLPNLSTLPFWKCDTCGNYVGCHYKTKDKTKPLGSIPTPEIRQARKIIHQVIDPLWKNNLCKRDEIYNWLTERLGYEYHTAKIKTMPEARIVVHQLNQFKIHLKVRREKQGFNNHKGVL